MAKRKWDKIMKSRIDKTVAFLHWHGVYTHGGLKPKKKCLLPGCENLTDHNGGYCSAEHCKQSRNKVSVGCY